MFRLYNLSILQGHVTHHRPGEEEFIGPEIDDRDALIKHVTGRIHVRAGVADNFMVVTLASSPFFRLKNAVNSGLGIAGGVGSAALSEKWRKISSSFIFLILGKIYHPSFIPQAWKGIFNTRMVGDHPFVNVQPQPRRIRHNKLAILQMKPRRCP